MLDADVVIGFLEPTDGQHAQAVAAIGPHLPKDSLMIGASVYSEVLVRPLRSGRPEIVDDFLRAAGIRVVSIDANIARAAAGLRARHRSLRLPDALALATAKEQGAHLLTLDERLSRIAGLKAHDVPRGIHPRP